MWACRICARQHERVYDACYNCPCFDEPGTAKRLRRRHWSLAARPLVASGFGGVLGLSLFTAGGLPAVDGLALGVAVGLVVGLLWVLRRWSVYPGAERAASENGNGE